MSNKFKIALALLASSSLIGLVGCGTPSSANAKQDSNAAITLKVAWWGSQDRNDRTQKVIQLFEQKYPNIHIETEYASFADYFTKMATEAAGQSLPDVMQMDFSYLNEYTSRNLLAPLDSYVQSGALNLKDVNQAYIAGGQVNNKLYAVSLGSNAPSVAIDPAVFAKAGVPALKEGYTYDDLINTARQLKQKIGTAADFYPIDANANSNSGFDFDYYLRQRGTNLFNKNGDGLGYSDDQYFTDYLNLELSLVKEGLMAPPQVLKGITSEPATLFVKGNAAIHPNASNQITAYTQYANRPLQLIARPSLAGGQEGDYIHPSQFFSVPANSKFKDAAVKFIDFFTNDLTANEILMAERGVPVSSKVRDFLLPKLDDATKQQFIYIEYVQQHSRPIDPAPTAKGSSKVMNDIFPRLQESVLYGQITPADAAKQFRQQATQALSGN